MSDGKDSQLEGKERSLLEEGEISKSEEEGSGLVFEDSSQNGPEVNCRINLGTDGSEDDADVDSESEEKLPICAQANLTRMRQQVKRLRAERKKLREDLALKAHELAVLKENQSPDSKSDGQLDGSVASIWNCPGCSKLKTKVEALKGKLAQARLQLGGGGEDAVKVEEGVEAVAENGLSLAEQVRQTAEAAVAGQGMLYEPTSGLYYHQASGYYFDAERSLYYDGNLGTWYRWDAEKEEYAVYSTAPEEEVAAHRELQRRKEEREQERRRAKEEKREKRRRANVEEPGSGNESSNSDNEDSDDDNEEDSVPPCVRMIVLDSGDPKVYFGYTYMEECSHQRQNVKFVLVLLPFVLVDPIRLHSGETWQPSHGDSARGINRFLR